MNPATLLLQQLVHAEGATADTCVVTVSDPYNAD
jgi:hypothetical protein